MHDELQDLYDAMGIDRGDVNVKIHIIKELKPASDTELWNSKKVKDKTGNG